MGKLVEAIPHQSLHELVNTGNVREYLIRCIVSQQLSIKVAPIIYKRFVDLYKGKFPNNIKIINTPVEDLRSCGLSLQKSNYIKNIAEYFHEHKIKDEFFQSMSDEEVLRSLTEIKGVGRWTAEMVLMFCLGRQDVFSPTDYGIMTAMKSIYKIRKEKKELEKKMISIAEKWRPYRSMACLYLWAYKDSKITI